MLAHVRRLIAHLVALAIVVGQVAPSFAQPLSKTDYEACQARDEAAFRTAIQGISVRALQAGIANVDYRAAVGDQWRRIGMDQIIDDRVDLAVEEIRKEMGEPFASVAFPGGKEAEPAFEFAEL